MEVSPHRVGNGGEGLSCLTMEDTTREHRAQAAGAESEGAPVESEQASTEQVAKSTGMMSALIFLSRVTGFVRTWAMAFALGNTVLAASYSLARNLPDMIYELVAGGVLATAFLPIYLQQRNTRSREAANAYASNLLSLVIVFLGGISVLASVFAPQVILTQSLFNNESSATIDNAVWLFRFFAFQILFYGINAVFSGLLNAERSYFWPSICSVFMNLVNIVMFFGYPFVKNFGETVGLLWLAIGTTLSIAVMAFVQVPALKKAGFRFHFGIDFHGEGLRETLQLALPAIACTAINLVSLSLANSVALSIADNGPASVSYAKMWYMFPYGVLGVALSTAMYTEMSNAMSRKDYATFKKQLNMGLRTTWLLIIPMAAMLFVCATELIGLYTAGSFTAEDVAPVAELLRAWSFALPLYAGYMFLYRAFSSLKDLKTVAKCRLVLTVVQVLVYMLAGGVIAIDGWDGIGLPALALGDFVLYLLMIVSLLLILRHRIGSFGFKDLAVATVKVIVASVAGALIAGLVEHGMSTVFNVYTIAGSLVVLVVTGVVGLAAIVVFCRLLGVNEIEGAIKAVLRRLRKK